MNSKRNPIVKADDLDTLSAIWILSCRDENSIMTYKGIAQRLAMVAPEDVDVIKDIVKSRPEFFRQGILRARLNTWKSEMRAGEHRPSWISEIKDKDDQAKAIDEITKLDCFRNQFRTGERAAKVDIEIIDWGLKHIERLRKDVLEERESRFKRIGMIWLPFGSLFLALVSVSVASVGQWKSIVSQEALKRYEVSFKPKQESYAIFMNQLMLAAIAANDRDERTVLDHINRMEAAYYQFEPFLLGPSRVSIFRKYNEFSSACLALVKSNREGNEAGYVSFVQQVAQLKGYFRTELFGALFGPEERP